MYSQVLFFPQLFEAQMEQTPDAVAVVFEDEQLSYQELNCRANQLAHYLRALSVGPEVLVGVYMERSLELAVGILGVLKAGGACVPLDPENSKARLAFMLEDTQVPVLLTQQRLLEDLGEISNHKMHVVCLDTSWEVIDQECTVTPVSGVTAESLAFVFYTSGSTGQPKGVMLPHRAVCKSDLQKQSAQQLTEVNRILLKISISFVGLVGELIRPLLVGDTVIIARPMGHQDSAYLVKLIAEQKITIVNFTPSMLQVFLEEQGLEACRHLRYVFCSGEVLPVKLQERFFTRLNAELHKIYGSTETGGVLYWNCKRGNNQQIISIDRQVYILGQDLQPVSIGDSGELHVGGAFLALGYLNRPELTSEKFIPNPFSDEPGARLYKTSDLARYLPDSNIELLGRLDNQVKIRGFRIELGEVESTLAQHFTIQQCVVTAREDILSGKRLVAYIVSNQEQAPSVNELRRFIKQKLPDYMVPEACVFLDALPLTPNGKIDRRALPDPDSSRPNLEEIFVAPRDGLELQLTKIWEQVLGIQPISVKDNFFALGGHSLLAVRLSAQIKKSFGKNLPLATLFQTATVEQLASVLRQEIQLVPWSLIEMVPPNGSKQPLFWLGLGYTMLPQFVKYLDADQPVYGITAGLNEMRNPTTHIKDWANGCINEIRAVQPEGPYFLGGYCLGGFIALEIAQQLQAQGQKVALLALVETESPDPIYRFYLKSVAYFRFRRRNLSQLSTVEQLAYILKPLAKRVNAWTISKFIKRNPDENVLTYNSKVSNSRKAKLAVQSYTMQQAYPGRVALFLSKRTISKFASFLFPQCGWSKLVASELELYLVPSDHASIVREPHVQTLAGKLSTCLDKIQKEEGINHV